MSKTLKAKAPAVLMAALFLFSAPTALAGERTESATRVAQAQPAPTTPAAQIAPTALAEEQAQPAPTAPAAEPTQPLPRIAQAQPAPTPTGGGFATKDDIRWWAEQNERRWLQVLDQINALHIAMITGLAVIIAALLGIIALLIPRKNAAPTESTRTLPRPTSA